MSEDRIPENTFIFKIARNRGKILHSELPRTKVEMYGAYQFSTKHKREERNFSPRVPFRPGDQQLYFTTMYRIRINEIWYRPGRANYAFFTKQEVIKILLDHMR